MPQITVVIPSYNCAAYLCDAVESVIAQTLSDWELVIIDDGSTDNSASVLSSYSTDSRIRYVRQENRGLPAARNAGAKLALGAYLAFLDADDRLAPVALERMLSEMQKTQASWCLVDVLKSGNGRCELQKTVLPSGNPYQEILKDDFIRRGMFFRRDEFFAVGCYDESMRYREDWELNIRMFSNRKSFAYVEEPLYLYSWRENSITTGDRPGMLVYTQKVLEKHHKRMAESGDTTYIDIYAASMWNLGRRHFYMKRYLQACKCLVESLRYRPSPHRILHPLTHHFKRLIQAFPHGNRQPEG